MTGTLIQQLTALIDKWESEPIEKERKWESAQQLRRVIEQNVPACPVIVCKEPEAVEQVFVKGTPLVKYDMTTGNFEPGPVEINRKPWDIETPHIPTLKLISLVFSSCLSAESAKILWDKIAELEGGK